MAITAHEAWISTKGSPSRSAFVSGFDAGRIEGRAEAARFMADNMRTVTEFAGERAPDLLAFMFNEMKPDAEPGDGAYCEARREIDGRSCILTPGHSEAEHHYSRIADLKAFAGSERAVGA